MKNSDKILQNFLRKAPILIDTAIKLFSGLGVDFSEEEMKGYKY